MKYEEVSRIREIWDGFEQSGDFSGDPWAKIQKVIPRVAAEIGPHITFKDVAEAAGSKAGDLYGLLARLEDARQSSA